MNRAILAFVATVLLSSSNLFGQNIDVRTGNCSPVNMNVVTYQPADMRFTYVMGQRVFMTPQAYVPVVGYTPARPLVMSASACKGAHLVVDPAVYPVFPGTVVDYTPVIPAPVFVAPPPPLLPAPLMARINKTKNIGFAVCECRRALRELRSDKEWVIDIDDEGEKLPEYLLAERPAITGTTTISGGKEYLVLAWTEEGEIKTLGFVRRMTRVIK